MSLDPAISRACFIRDLWKCRHCKSRNGLHPHHVIYKSHGGQDQLNNLLSLCAECHRAHHDGFLEIVVLAVLDTDLLVRFVRKRGWMPRG